MIHHQTGWYRRSILQAFVPVNTEDRGFFYFIGKGSYGIKTTPGDRTAAKRKIKISLDENVNESRKEF